MRSTRITGLVAPESAAEETGLVGCGPARGFFLGDGFTVFVGGSMFLLPGGCPNVLESLDPVHRVLVRNGLLASQLSRRPRAEGRLEREIATDLWQIDATCLVLADGTEVWVVDVIDDHSRYLLAAEAGPAATGDPGAGCLRTGCQPLRAARRVLSDNGLIFTGSGWFHAIGRVVVGSGCWRLLLMDWSRRLLRRMRV